MAITKILQYRAIGETIAAAFIGRSPISLHVDLWDEPNRLYLGQAIEARLRHRTPDGRGAFLETEAGETVYMERAPTGPVSDGALVEVCVAAEARRGKHARVAALKSRGPGTAETSLDGWRQSLPGADRLVVEEVDTPEPLLEALAIALDPICVLPGGGVLTLTRTPALTAADVDTAGRIDKGRAGDRAAAINTAAAAAFGHKLALTGLGGLAVLDCIAPITPPQKTAIKAALLGAFRQGSTRKIAALAPSPFGLLEASIAWGPRPIDEAYLGEAGKPLPRTRMLEGLRALEREARADPAGALALLLPESAYGVFKRNETAYLDALNRRYGGRLRVVHHDRPNVDIRHGDP